MQSYLLLFFDIVHCCQFVMVCSLSLVHYILIIVQLKLENAALTCVSWWWSCSFYLFAGLFNCFEFMMCFLSLQSSFTRSEITYGHWRWWTKFSCDRCRRTVTSTKNSSLFSFQTYRISFRYTVSDFNQSNSVTYLCTYVCLYDYVCIGVHACMYVNEWVWASSLDNRVGLVCVCRQFKKGVCSCDEREECSRQSWPSADQQGKYLVRV